MSAPDRMETSQKILESALALWSEKGYQQSTMRELARRTGMGVSSLYFYFRSKEEIVQYLYRVLNEQARQRFHEERGTQELGKRLQRFLEIKLALLEPHRSVMAAIAREAVDPESALSPWSSESASPLTENLAFFKDLVAQSGVARRGDQDALVRAIWLGHLGVILYWLHDRSPSSANTHRLLRLMTGAVGRTRLLRLIPGASELLGLLGGLFPVRGDAPAGPAAAAGEPAGALRAREVDVVVVGGGPIGVLYACFLKRARPRTRVLVLDRQAEPGHKVGESTLSGFVKAVRTVGVSRDVMRRLFFPKNGLAFYHVDETVRDITRAPEYVLETFDETFQVERRVLDSLLLAQARRLGVQVVQGAAFDYEGSRLSAGGNDVTWRVGATTFRTRASLLVDASGPASVLSRHLGLRTDEGVPFQTGSVWTYYAGIKPLASYTGWAGRAQFPRDQYTVHLCFREGWLWYIPLVSWQSAPTANLGRALDRLLEGGRNLPERAELVEEFACPAEPVVSIGLSLRGDRDRGLHEDPVATFQRYQKKYPAIGRLLEGARQLPDYYGAGHTFLSRLDYRGHARRVAGDGWLLVGDAAFFVDPLISPGLTGGTATAWQAAAATVRALDSGILSGDVFGPYQAFVARLHEALERDNELVYMSFNHPEALALVQRFQEIDARRHFLAHANQDYGEADTDVWGVLEPSYQRLQKAAWAVLREEEEAVGREVPVGEQSGRDYGRMVGRLRDVLGTYLDDHGDLNPYARRNAGGR